MHISLVRGRMLVIPVVTAAVVGVLGCFEGADPVFRDLTATMTGMSFTARVDSGATTTISDTLVTQDTALVAQIDTVLAPPDTVLISLADTVLVQDTLFVTDTVVSGTDTTFVLDTIIALDTVVVARVDTVIVVDTVLVAGTDTVVTFDTVVVVQEVPVVPNIATTASSVSLTVGQTVQLGANLENALGQQATSSDIAWRSFNVEVAGVTSSGLVSGVASGQTDLQARDTVRGLFEEIPVTVMAADATQQQQQQISGAQGGGPHEPSNFTPYAERNFNTTSGEGGWWVHDPNGNLSVVQDVTAPTGGKSLAGRITFREGTMGNIPPITGFSLNPQPSEVYMSVYHRVSPNWQGHSSSINKIFWIPDPTGAGAGGSSPFGLTGSAVPSSTGIEYRGGKLRNGPFQFDNNRTRVRVPYGEWAFVEVLLRAQQSPGSSDGEFHLWVNGTKTAEYTNVEWVAADGNRTWREVKWEPVWGGTGDIIEERMYQYIDHWYVSGR